MGDSPYPEIEFFRKEVATLQEGMQHALERQAEEFGLAIRALKHDVEALQLQITELPAGKLPNSLHRRLDLHSARLDEISTSCTILTRKTKHLSDRLDTVLRQKDPHP